MPSTYSKTITILSLHLIFVSVRTPLDPAMPYYTFKKFIKELKLRDEPFHVLRHTHTTELLRAGIPAHVVAFRIGDEVATIQKTYAHVIAKDDRKSADTFAERIKSA